MVITKPNIWSFSSQTMKYLFTSFLLIISGMGLLFGSVYIFTTFLQGQLNLVEGGYLNKLWQRYPMPIYLELYVFNWTNPEDIHKPGIKPRFQEIGPFTFKDLIEKGNLTWNENDTVTFQQYHTFWFDREKSAADLDLHITTINSVLVSLVHVINQRQYGYWIKRSFQIALDILKTELITTKTMRELVFEGYYDPVVKWSQSVRLPFIPKLHMNEKFSWLYGRNRSSFEGTFNMGTSYDNFRVLKQWNYSNTTSHYKGICSQITGQSAGDFQRAYPKGSISIFVADLCRYIPLDYQEVQEIKGVSGKKYSASLRFLDNGTLYPENKCYCPTDCFPSGVLNISGCHYGAPVFVSLPHFHKADDYYLDKVEGLKPEKEKHEFYMTLDPVTGILLNASVRLQLNVLVRPVTHLRDFHEIPTLMFPVFWVQEVIQVPNYILNTLKIISYIPIMAKTVGAILSLLGFYFFYAFLHSFFKNTNRFKRLSTSEKCKPHLKRPINWFS